MSGRIGIDGRSILRRKIGSPKTVSQTFQDAWNSFASFMIVFLFDSCILFSIFGMFLLFGEVVKLSRAGGVTNQHFLDMYETFDGWKSIGLSSAMSLPSNAVAPVVYPGTWEPGSKACLAPPQSSISASRVPLRSFTAILTNASFHCTSFRSILSGPKSGGANLLASVTCARKTAAS